MLLNRIFYTLKPAMPRRVQISIRRQIALYKQKKYAHLWPIDPNAGDPPKGWKGWPDGKKFALVLSHDVDTQKGHNNALKLAGLEEKLGFRSSFNFVPQRYSNSDTLFRKLTEREFEIGVHGLKHDGKLFMSKTIFRERAKRINYYLEKWNSVGFYSPSMHHNLEWIHDLNIEYDQSTFDTDPFEPQADGVRTIFPFWVQNSSTPNGYVELPYTLPQDFTLFIILRKKTNKIWKEKLDWIAENGGLVLLNTHPCYMNMRERKLGFEEYPVTLYLEFLDYVKNKYTNSYYHVLPKEIARFWRSRYLPLEN